MIHINLLPVKEIKNRNRAKFQILIASICFFCFLMVITGFIWHQENMISDLGKKNTEINAEKSKYNKIFNEIKKLEDEKKVLETRIAIIKNLKIQSSLTVHVLDEIAKRTPQNRMWLKSLSQQSNNLDISGIALDDQTIAQYMEELEVSLYIKNVVLLNANLELQSGKNLKSFKISCSSGYEEITGNTSSALTK